jgi:hypothetical protein
VAKLAATVHGIAGADGLLSAAMTAIPRAALESAGAARRVGALTHMRPDLWVPVLLERAARDETPLNEVGAPVLNALELFETFCGTHLGKAKASSSSSKQREATVALTAIAGAAMDMATAPERRAAGVPCVFAEAMKPLLDVVGHPRFAKSGPARNALLLSLFQLAGALKTAKPRVGDATWRAALDALAARGPNEVRAAIDVIVQDVGRRFARADDPGTLLDPVLADRRGSEGLKRYLNNITASYQQGVEADAAKRLLTALLEGTLDDDRRESLTPARFRAHGGGKRELQRVFDGYSRGGTSSAASLLEKAGLPPHDHRAQWQGIDSADVLDWVRAVDDQRSCQSTDGSTHLNRGLLNRFEDGSVRLLALRDASGKTQARAAMRLVLLGKRDPKLALLVDRAYVDTSGTQAERRDDILLLGALALARGEALGLPVVFTRPGLDNPKPATVTLPPPLATDYLDFGSGVTPPTADLSAMDLTAEVHEPPGKQRARLGPFSRWL